jgi:predicted acyl esterase
LLLVISVSVIVASRAEAQTLPSTVQVAMPDGVSLATDVWRPLLDGTPRPVLLRRTPYGRTVDFNTAQALVAAGFVLVSQDVRGRGNSGGVFEPFFDDKVDGKATIEWAAAQAWSTGDVATYSNSAEGVVQYMAMASAPKGLRCAHLGMPSHDVYESLFPGGAWRTDLGTRWLTGLGAADVVELWKSHEVRDHYWDDATLSTAEMASINHPVFIMGGFFDIFAQSQVRALRELQTHVVPSSRGDVFLILGPWTHGGSTLRRQGDLIFPEDVPYTNWANELLAYLKWCTQHGPRPEFAQVRYYLTVITDQTMIDPADMVTRTVASGEWRDATTWPPPGGRPQRLFVSDTGLRAEPAPAAPLPIAVEADAAVPSLGGGNLTEQAGPLDQAAVDMRRDVLLFVSEPVAEAVEVVGTPSVNVWVSSATTDLDVVVRLEVLTQAGKAIALTDGVLRGRFARGFDAVRPLTPGEPTRFVITLGPTAVRLTPGQALRIAISGSSSPRYEPNPNVATPLAAHPATVSTTLTLYRDATHPSELVLPVTLGRLPGAQAIDEKIELDGGVVMADAGPDRDGARDAGARSQPSDAAIGGLDAGAQEQATQREASGGCACSASVSPTRLDLGSLLLFTIPLLRRRRQPRLVYPRCWWRYAAR